jgi:hypothetical protein
MLRPKSGGVKMMAVHGSEWDECLLHRRRHRES